MPRAFFALFATSWLAASLAGAQQFTAAPCPSGGNGDGSSNWLFGRQEHACEIRKITLPLDAGHVRVQGENGGIQVYGEDRRDVYLEARVTAQGSTPEEAQKIMHQVAILTHGAIEAKGPSTSGWPGRGWSVSFTVRVPRQLAGASLHTTNGPIAVTDVAGAIDLDTTNGGLQLRFVEGDIHAQTTNGGIAIALSGNRLHGRGIDAQTTNGGIHMTASPNLSAHLVADTTNGSIHVGYPSTAGEHIRNSVDTNIGSGGATVKLETTNGGIDVQPN